jgi:hypothetical protein
VCPLPQTTRIQMPQEQVPHKNPNATDQPLTPLFTEMNFNPGGNRNESPSRSPTSSPCSSLVRTRETSPMDPQRNTNLKEEWEESNSVGMEKTKTDFSYPNGRKRASKACFECQRRHTRCGFERPCARCKRLGIECIEVQSSKKRGRSYRRNSDFSICYEHSILASDSTSVSPSVSSTKKQKVSHEWEQPFVQQQGNNLHLSIGDLTKTDLDMQQLFNWMHDGTRNNISIYPNNQQQQQMPLFQEMYLSDVRQNLTPYQLDPLDISQQFPTNLGLSTQSQQQQQLLSLLRGTNNATSSPTTNLTLDNNLPPNTRNSFHITNNTANLSDQNSILLTSSLLAELEALCNNTAFDSGLSTSLNSDTLLLSSQQQQQQFLQNQALPQVDDYQPSHTHERLMRELSNLKPEDFSLNIDLFRNNYLFSDRMGVIISFELPNISFISESILVKLGYPPDHKINTYYDIFLSQHINWILQNVKEQRLQRLQFINSKPNGFDILRDNYLKNESKGRILVVDKNGYMQEVIHRCYRIYSRFNPITIEAVYTFLFW